MTKNPLINAAAAFLYIIVVACVMYYGSEVAMPAKSVFAPIAILSLFTLSAAVMGYIFLFQPLQLYFDGKKKESVNLFSKTLGAFAIITTIILLIFFSGAYKSFM